MKKGKPSATALLIARSQALLSMEDKFSYVVSPQTARLSRLFARRGNRSEDALLRLLRLAWFRRIVWKLEKALLPGIFPHYALRKKMIREIAEKSIQEGFTRIVILGAGYDDLSFYLCEKYPAIRVAEYDDPNTQAVKIRALRREGNIAEKIEFIPRDLAATTSGLEGWINREENESTLYIAEGLLMYLSPDAVRKLLPALGEQSRGATRILFTFLEPGRRGHAEFTEQNVWIDRWLSWKGEKFQWGCRRQKIRAFLGNLGYETLMVRDPDRTPEGEAGSAFGYEKMNIGEFVCLAEREGGRP